MIEIDLSSDRTSAARHNRSEEILQYANRHLHRQYDVTLTLDTLERGQRGQFFSVRSRFARGG
jgi:hypothetical protein